MVTLYDLLLNKAGKPSHGTLKKVRKKSSKLNKLTEVMCKKRPLGGHLRSLEVKCYKKWLLTPVF